MNFETNLWLLGTYMLLSDSSTSSIMFVLPF